MSEENRDNFKTYMVKGKNFTDLIIKDKEDNYYYSAIYVNELQQEIERLNNIINEAIEYIDRRDIEWGSEEHNKLLSILKRSDENV